MRSRWSVSLPIALATALLATGVASTLVKPSNPTSLPTGLNVAANAESTALYCTGLSNGAAGVAGQVTFLNTTDAPRTLVLYVASDTHARARRTMRLAAHVSASVRPDKIVAGNGFAVAALIDGGGVVAEEVTSDRAAETPCVSAGVTDWYASGFDTLVGSSGSLSIYNPTATPAVLNVSAFTTTGFVAPPSFQGLAVGAHQQMELKLGDQIVNATNIGVRVRVLRGSLAIVGVQRSGRVVSLNPYRQARSVARRGHSRRETPALYRQALVGDGGALQQ